MSQQEADEDECSGESANYHFHKEFLLSLFETARNQRPKDHAVETADKGVTRQWASAGRTADKLVISETQTATDYCTNNNLQDHDRSPGGSAWNPASDNLVIFFIEF